MSNIGLTTETSKHRQRLVAPILLVLLLVSVLLAWWLSTSRGQLVNAGRDIITDIHQSGLSTYWKGPQQLFYIIMQKDEILGYRAEFRWPLAQGGFEGLSVVMLAAEREWPGLYEHWVLSPDATEGKYTAGRVHAAGRLLQDTEIIMNGRVVQVAQRLPKGTIIRSRSSVPENYLPEGTLPLAMQLVAQRKSNAYFKLIYNSDYPPVSQRGQVPQTRFGLANMEYAGVQEVPDDGPVQAATVKLRKGSLGREEAAVYFIDQDGEVVLITTADDRQRRLSLQQLLAIQPTAAQDIQMVARLLDIQLPPMENTSTNPLN